MGQKSIFVQYLVNSGLISVVKWSHLLCSMNWRHSGGGGDVSLPSGHFDTYFSIFYWEVESTLPHSVNTMTSTTR